MGGLDILGYRQILGILPLLLPGLGLLLYHARDLNHIALSEDLALAQGVDVQLVRRNVFVGGGLATAAVVSLVGPIGFVGLIVPHAVRRLSGVDLRMVLPAAFLLGGAALAVCDTVARTVLAPTELPVGIITALIGGPLFIHLLISQRWR
jgi:iron complex transport system permease protein